MTKLKSALGKGTQVTVVVGALLVSGCTALTKQVLVDEKAQAAGTTAGTTHCAGSEWMDNSVMAVVPIPIIGLGMPTQEINQIKRDDVLAKCGPPDRLVNRRVEVDRTACVPTVLTRVISLGVWQWCPASVSYSADVKQPETPRTVEFQQPEPAPTSSEAVSGTKYPYPGNRPSYMR
jgi:hypothetical protein